MSRSLSAGIVGLPNAGKSTLFNALTAAGVAAEAYPFTTIEPNIGVVEVPDPRLDRLFEILRPPRKVPATVRFVDIAGLAEGAHAGEGLGNRFLAHIREVEVIVHVVRCFEAPDVAHPLGSVDPARDIAIVETELVLADLETVQRRGAARISAARSGDRDAQQEIEVLDRWRAWLDQGRSARTLRTTGDLEDSLAGSLFLLSGKPVLYVANVSESAAVEDEDGVEAVRSVVEDAPVLPLAVQLEAELLGLAEPERLEYLNAVGLSEPGLHRLIRATYGLLGLITFFTFNEKEVRAWTLREGATAPEAAGLVHSDFEAGFIRAEASSYDDFVRTGSMKAAREAGFVRIEGRDYAVRDGDILFFLARA